MRLGLRPPSATRIKRIPSALRRSACAVMGGRESCASPSVNTTSTRSASSELACSSSRSEEHTSELQSPCNIVCRLLLEKKNGWLFTCIDRYHVDGMRDGLRH